MVEGGQDGINVYRVHTILGRHPIIGSDSCIAVVPDEWYVRVPGQEPMLDLRRLGRDLRNLSEQSAARIGERLHHAEWVITSDPAVVERRGMHDTDCARCRADVDQALARLAEVDDPLLVGILYWAGR